ncbi:hypothetical protein FACS1894219_05960 [Clostridia bacterium]|nr:hypothetical protein FACS1894219_05960 [Clostridia bacterium]
MTREFTCDQLDAIRDRNRTLLVSAGAGSGKTAVLTERVIAKLSEDETLSVTDFLIVTFTKASAADLKRKLAEALEDSKIPRLRQQRHLLGAASISTIHSFCLRIVRENSNVLGIPSRFRVGDTNEMNLIRRSVLDQLTNNSEQLTVNGERVSAGDETSVADDLYAAAEALGGSDSDDSAFAETLLRIESATENHAERNFVFDSGIESMEEILSLDDYGSGFFTDTAFGRDLCAGESRKIAECETLAEACISLAKKTDVLTKKFADVFDTYREFYRAAGHYLQSGSFSDMFNLIADFKPARVGGLKLKEKLDEELKPRLDAAKDRLSDTYKGLKNLFGFTVGGLKDHAERYKKILSAVKNVIGAYRKMLAAEKIRLKAFEFADLERYASEVLKNDDVAGNLKSRYREIYIDEYQDTNPLQDSIFRSISTEDGKQFGGNRFMVGDVKQSIYAFRGAEPTIFTDYAKHFAQYSACNIAAHFAQFAADDTAAINTPRLIRLSKNFRSCEGVINFINFVFERIMTDEIGGVDYKSGEALEAGVKSGDDSSFTSGKSPAVKLILVQDENEDVSSYDDADDSGDEPDLVEEDSSEISTEALAVAAEIAKLVASGCSPRDIVILLRRRKKAQDFAAALDLYGIKSHSEKPGTFFKSAEIMLMTSLLRAIDNPTRDIDLAAIMKSPLYGFTVSELRKIREEDFPSASKITPFYRRVENFARESSAEAAAYDEATAVYSSADGALFDKAIEFEVTDEVFYAEAMEEDESFAEAMFGDEVPSEESSSEASDENELRQKCASFLADMRKLRARARGELCANYLAWLYKRFNIAGITGSEEARCLNLLKFYEYARQFESTVFRGLYGFISYIEEIKRAGEDYDSASVTAENDEAVRIMTVHKSKGLEFPVVFLADTAAPYSKLDYTRDPVITKNGISFALVREDGIGRERTPMRRVRAEESRRRNLSEEARVLYVAMTRAKEKLIISGATADLVKFMAANTVKNESGIQPKIIGATSSLTLLFPAVVKPDGMAYEESGCEFAIISRDEIAVPTPVERNRGEAAKQPREHEAASPPHERDEVAAQPHKRDGIADEPLAARRIPAKTSVTERLREKTVTPLVPLPDFLADMPGNNRAALAGTATHLFMQNADFILAKSNGAANEAKRLTLERFLSAEESALVDYAKADKFFASDFYKLIESSRKIYRELPFNLLLPGEDSIIQGVIDLVFYSNDKIYVVDFKTDRAQGELGEKILIDRHSDQLKFYCRAAREIFGADEDLIAGIYSFALAKFIPVDSS